MMSSRGNGRMLLVVLITGASWIALPGAGVASVRFGADLTQPASAPGLGCAAEASCTYATTVAPSAGGQIKSPVAGTVVRVLIVTRSGSTAPTLTFHVIASADGGTTFTGAGTSSAVPTPTTTGVTPFPVQLPIQAGDYIGVDFGGPASTTLFALSSQAGANISGFKPALMNGGTPLAPQQQISGVTLQVAADVAVPPTSDAEVPPCSASGAIPATVTADPDPAVAPKAIHFRIDSGPVQTVATTDNPGNATITVPNGSHTLEYWGEDTLGQQEAAHHTTTVVVGCTSLTVGKAGSGSGTVTSSDGQIDCGQDCSHSYNSGTAVILTASPAAGSTFAGWSGGGCSGSGTCAVAMDADKAVLASFTPVPPSAKITKAKVSAKTGKATFKFEAVGQSSGFQCELKIAKKAKFKKCRSPKTYEALKPGEYTFEVRAVGTDGTTGTPVKKRFTIG